MQLGRQAKDQIARGGITKKAGESIWLQKSPGLVVILAVKEAGVPRGAPGQLLNILGGSALRPPYLAKVRYPLLPRLAELAL